jgi:hypothetical protein
LLVWVDVCVDVYGYVLLEVKCLNRERLHFA